MTPKGTGGRHVTPRWLTARQVCAPAEAEFVLPILCSHLDCRRIIACEYGVLRDLYDHEVKAAVRLLDAAGIDARVQGFAPCDGLDHRCIPEDLDPLNWAWVCWLCGTRVLGRGPCPGCARGKGWLDAC